jgi:hypothetical protein
VRGSEVADQVRYAVLSANEMADYVRLCELGATLERAAARWFEEQAERSVQRAAARPSAT